MNKETTPEEYWASVAEELGEPVRAFSLARLVAGEELQKKGLVSAPPQWVLVFITDSALYIERGGTQNWFQRLMTSRGPTEEPERQRVPLDSITKVTFPPEKRGLYRFLAAPEVLVQIAHTGSPGTLLVYLDRRGPNDQKLMDCLADLKTPG